VHQDHVTGRGSILDHLERYSINVFDTFVKPRNARVTISGGAQIPDLRVELENLTELRTSCVGRRWILGKPPMNKTMRSA
jgi:hypothetical protein